MTVKAGVLPVARAANVAGKAFSVHAPGLATPPETVVQALVSQGPADWAGSSRSFRVPIVKGGRRAVGARGQGQGR